jgi:hypothetical protein
MTYEPWSWISIKLLAFSFLSRGFEIKSMTREKIDIILPCFADHSISKTQSVSSSTPRMGYGFGKHLECFTKVYLEGTLYP